MLFNKNHEKDEQDQIRLWQEEELEKVKKEVIPINELKIISEKINEMFTNYLFMKNVELYEQNFEIRVRKEIIKVISEKAKKFICDSIDTETQKQLKLVEDLYRND